MALVLTMNRLEVTVTTDGEGAEAVAKALQPFAHDDSVFLEQLDHSNDKGDEFTVKICIDGDKNTPALRLRLEETLFYLRQLYPLPVPIFSELKGLDWPIDWKDQYQPLRVGERFLIQPSWQEVTDAQASDIVLTLNPSAAFGTGLHPSTQLSLQALERLVKPGMRVLDIGAGSGILSIAAAKLNASQVLGVEIDPHGVEMAKKNVTLNHIETPVTIVQGELANVSQRDWDVIVANITPSVISALFREHDLIDYLAANGRLILSGIMQRQTEVMIDAIETANGHLEHTHTLGQDWVAFIVTK